MFLLHLLNTVLAAIMNLFNMGVSESSISFKSQPIVYFLPRWSSESRQGSQMCPQLRQHCPWEKTMSLAPRGWVSPGQDPREEAILTHSPHKQWNCLSTTFACWPLYIGSRSLQHVAVYHEEGLFGKLRVQRWRNQHNNIFVCTCFPDVVSEQPGCGHLTYLWVKQPTCLFIFKAGTVCEFT